MFEFECVPASDDTMNTGPQDWALCGTDSSRRAVLKESTFVLVFAPSTIDFVSTTLLQARIYEALRSGKCVKLHLQIFCEYRKKKIKLTLNEVERNTIS